MANRMGKGSKGNGSKGNGGKATAAQDREAGGLAVACAGCNEVGSCSCSCQPQQPASPPAAVPTVGSITVGTGATVTLNLETATQPFEVVIAGQPAGLFTLAPAASVVKPSKQTAGNGPAPRYTLHGHAATAVIRWLASKGYTASRVKKVFEHYNVPVASATISTQCQHGRAGTGGKLPQLTAEAEAELLALVAPAV